MIVVSDTSVLTSLIHVGQLGLLRELYGSVLIPTAVQRRELTLLSFHFQTPHGFGFKRTAKLPSDSHFAERGCLRSIRRSAWICITAWGCSDVLRLVETTLSESKEAISFERQR